LEWAQFLPEQLLVKGREKKILLREAYRDELPRAVLDRPKQGFGAPIGEWMKGALHEWTEDLLPSPLFERKWQTNLEGQRRWAMAAFSGWARQWRASW
jgi:asparagine synthase (glutamine-hydrolysing)